MIEECTKCGSSELEKIKGFGGHYTIKCKKCHEVLETGKD